VIPRPAGGTLAGVVLYLCALAMFASMDASTKSLVGAAGGLQLPVTEVMWARFLFSLLAVVIALVATGQRLPWRARAPRLQILRSLCLASCNLLFALALVHVRLADATAINFAGPVITVVLAAAWLKESVGWRRWVGVGVGMLGVLLVLRPGQGAVHPAGFYAFGCAFMFAVYQILTRKLAGIDSARTTILQTGLWSTLACSVLAPFDWVWPDVRGWAVMVALGVLGAGGHFLLVLAYARAPASVLAPLGYSSLVWSTLFGILLFSEMPDLATLAGAAVIAASSLLVIRTGKPT
jgi:drug/metabolite transporter (DMT)-like permease